MPDRETTIDDLKNVVRRFVTERNWAGYHDPKNLSMSIAIEAAELMEHFQWLKNSEIDHELNDPKSREAIEDELADVLAYVLSFANTLNIDLSSALTQKMAKNEKKYPADTYRGKFRL
jgi:NTP pyrophosphatase (non-canonical NTP hydrolase)